MASLYLSTPGRVGHRAEDHEREKKIEKSAEKNRNQIEKTAENEEDSMRVKPNTLRSALLPTPLESTAMELMRSVNQRLIEEFSIGETTRALPVPPIGSTASWLSGTDDDSRAGGVNQQDAHGNPSEPEPWIIPLYGSNRGHSGIS